MSDYFVTIIHVEVDVMQLVMWKMNTLWAILLDAAIVVASLILKQTLHHYLMMIGNGCNYIPPLNDAQKERDINATIELQKYYQSGSKAVFDAWLLQATWKVLDEFYDISI